MGRKTIETNHRVVIEPRSIGNCGWFSMSDYAVMPDPEQRRKEYERICEGIVSEVRRHVSEVGSVRVEHDEESTCEHCGYEWTEDSDTFNGGCCDEDMKNEPVESIEVINGN